MSPIERFYHRSASISVTRQGKRSAEMDGVAGPWAGRLSLGWLTLPGATSLEQIEAAASAGFSDVGLKFARRPGDTEPALSEKPWLFADIANSLRDNRIALLNM